MAVAIERAGEEAEMDEMWSFVGVSRELCNFFSHGHPLTE
jgi:hypothetical protein